MSSSTFLFVSPVSFKADLAHHASIHQAKNNQYSLYIFIYIYQQHLLYTCLSLLYGTHCLPIVCHRHPPTIPITTSEGETAAQAERRTRVRVSPSMCVYARYVGGFCVCVCVTITCTHASSRDSCPAPTMASPFSLLRPHPSPSPPPHRQNRSSSSLLLFYYQLSSFLLCIILPLVLSSSYPQNTQPLPPLPKKECPTAGSCRRQWLTSAPRTA